MLFIKVTFIYYEAPTMGQSARSLGIHFLPIGFSWGRELAGISSLMPTDKQTDQSQDEEPVRALTRMEQ